jgi:hypothetical protein
MPISNYPGGFIHGVTIRGVPIQQMFPGEVFWVNNSTVLAKGAVNGSNGNKGTYTHPFSTIAKGLSSATASRGDIVAVMPGHSETITTDGGLALNKAGVCVAGLGAGTLRPKVVLDTAAAAAITVTAANVTMMNFQIEASFADITNAFDVTAAWFSLIECEFMEEGADLNFLDLINCSSTTDNTADGLRVEGCVATAVDAAQASFVESAADIDRLVFKDNFVTFDADIQDATINLATGKKLTDCLVLDNMVNNISTQGDLLILTDTATNTGTVARNYVGHLDTASEVLNDATGTRSFENRSCAADDKSGYLLPAADS